MEKSVELLSTLLKKDVNEVNDLLASDEGAQQLEETVKGLKAYSTDEFANVVNNLRKDYKDSVYSEVKGAAMEMFEKDLQKEFGTELKRGEDYSNAMELVKKVLDSKTPVAGDDSELQKEISSLRDLLKNQKEENEKAITDLSSARDKEIANYLLDGAIKPLKSMVDADENVADGQLRLFEIAFKQDYQIRKNDDGSYIVWDTKREEVVKNDDFSPATVDQVVQRVAPSYLPLKDVAPKKGRGSEFQKQVQQSTSSRINWAKYGNDFDQYYQAELKGKGIQYGSTEMNQLYRQFKEEVG
jgi:hypothetical protein